MGKLKYRRKLIEVKEHKQYFTEGDEFSNTKGGTKL